MARLWFALGVVGVAFTVYSVVDCLMTARHRVRGVPKLVWVLVIVALPVVGGVLWLFIGRGPQHEQRIAPDDDPAFLSSLPRRPRPPSGLQRTKDEERELRRLEAELADLNSADLNSADLNGDKLDRDADDDGDAPRRG